MQVDRCASSKAFRCGYVELRKRARMSRRDAVLCATEARRRNEVQSPAWFQAGRPRRMPSIASSIFAQPSSPLMISAGVRPPNIAWGQRSQLSTHALTSTVSSSTPLSRSMRLTGSATRRWADGEVLCTGSGANPLGRLHVPEKRPGIDRRARWF